MHPSRAAAQLEGRGHRAGGRHQQQRRGTYRQRVGGQELSRRLLLYLGCVVGQDVGRAGARRHQLLADFTDAAQPFPRGQESRLCVHLQRRRGQGVDRSPGAPRRQPHLPASQRRAGTTYQRSSADRLGNPKLPLAGAGHERGARNRLSRGADRGRRCIHSRHRRHLRVRFGVLHHRSGGKLPAGSRRRGEANCRRGRSQRQPRQPDHPDRENRHPATGPRDQPAPATGRAATGAGPGAAHGVRRLSHRARSARQQPQPYLSRRGWRQRCPAGSQDPDRLA